MGNMSIYEVVRTLTLLDSESWLEKKPVKEMVKIFYVRIKFLQSMNWINNIEEFSESDLAEACKRLEKEIFGKQLANIYKLCYDYLDWTREPEPRVFYVGKGNYKRSFVKITRRNQKHTNVTNKYGQRREVVLGTKDEQFAFDIEIELINFRIFGLMS